MESQSLSTLEVSLYAHIYDKHVEFKNLDNTTDLNIDKYKFYEGHVVVEFKDHRQNPSCDGKRQLLRKNDDSLWNEVLRLNQSIGSSWTYEQAIQIEAKLLVLLHPNLDLNPNSIPEWIIPAQSSESNTMPTHRKLKKRKRKPNSSEKEEEKVKRTKNEKMMFMMDERHNKEFKPEFRLTKYFNQQGSTNDEASLPPIIDKGKKKMDSDEIKRLEAKKSLGKRTRSIRFERDCLSISAEGQKSVDKFYKVQTLINVYCDRKSKYTVIVHTLDERELKATGEFSKFVRMVDGARYYIKLDDAKAFLKYEFHTKNEYLSFIEAFIILYGIDNKIKHDSEKTSLSTAHELAEGYSKKQFVLEVVKAKQPHQIVEFLAQKPPSEVVQSPFEFKFNNQNIKIQSIPDLVTATSIKESQQPEILVVDTDRIAMPPPPSLPQHKRNLINNHQISSQIQSSLFSGSTQTSTQSNNYQSLLSFQQNHQSSLSFQIPVQSNNNNYNNHHQSSLKTPEQSNSYQFPLSFQTLVQLNNNQSPLQTPIKSNSYQSFLSSQTPVQRHQSPLYLQTPIQYNNDQSLHQSPLSFQIPTQSNNHQSFSSSQTPVQPNSHQSPSSSFQTPVQSNNHQSPLSFQTLIRRPSLSFETPVQSNSHQSPSSFQTLIQTPIQSNNYQSTLSQQPIIIQYPINSDYSSSTQVATAEEDCQYIQQPSTHNKISNHQPNMNNQNSSYLTSEQQQQKYSQQIRFAALAQLHLQQYQQQYQVENSITTASTQPQLNNNVNIPTQIDNYFLNDDYDDDEIDISTQTDNYASNYINNNNNHSSFANQDQYSFM
ncbi:hypothetical protein Glove_121g78 [Diversispora epigaea]|uniref:Spt20-like SEP domain-containing protein n=1 Tax=Diversispora epigaea TaxID=1348612 RepID=A0A397J3S8_9GLOM|nr:hypothetical protein Glove_121g78 [Diversispora epigaea]